MNYWNQSKDQIYVAGHRGCRVGYPENTMEAFRAALAWGVDQIETDVRITKDGELVLIHDATVDRTTDGTGRVCDYTLEALKQLDAGSKTSEAFRGCRIPTLEELMELVKDHPTITLDIELKEYPTEGWETVAYDTCDRTLKMLEAYGFRERVVINSWNGKLNEYIYDRYSSAWRQHVYHPMSLMSDCGRDPLEYGYCACVFDQEEGVFQQILSKGVQAWVGTNIRDEAAVEKARELGAVLITCDDPPTILSILRKHGWHR